MFTNENSALIFKSKSHHVVLILEGEFQYLYKYYGPIRHNNMAKNAQVATTLLTSCNKLLQQGDIRMCSAC